MISICTPTHKLDWLRQAWDSFKDSKVDFEWVIGANGKLSIEDVKNYLPTDPRIKVVRLSEFMATGVIGALKRQTFMQATGDILVELDHDDLLVPDALEKIKAAFEDQEVGFVYSDCADFSPTGLPVTYHDPKVKAAWEADGWSFYGALINNQRYLVPHSRPADDAGTFAHLYYAPNHVRAWRASVYRALGGHNPDFEVADDHELLIRTYLTTKCHHIPEVLYLYRVEDNTWSKNIELIATKTVALQEEYLERLVLRQCALRGQLAVELGCGEMSRSGWIGLDLRHGPIVADLTQKWPFADNSIGAFRAVDLLEHLPDKQHTMAELHRCLAPGGWLLSLTPSAEEGVAAFSDPTHKSFWAVRTFRYYTEAALAKFIGGEVQFKPFKLQNVWLSEWHKNEKLLYIQANLQKLPTRARRETVSP